jgi:enoyl-[acyl-carrier-protein] reductase (NADH)
MNLLGYWTQLSSAISSLAADASSSITGQVWSVDGGMDM